MSNLLDKASIILTPTAYNNGKALCVKPSDGSGDFDFSRNSAATRVNAQGLVENVQILSSNLVQNPSFSEEGVQEVSNGSFTNGSTDWVLNDWTVANGKASLLNGSSFINQNNILEVGKTYKIQYTISDYVSGNVRWRAAGVNGSVNTSNGAVTDYITVASTSFSIQGYNGFTGSITNISAKEVGQNWDLGSGFSIGNNKAILTNGTDSTYQIFQGISGLNTKRLKVTFDISNFSGSAEIRYPLRHNITANGSYFFEGVGDFDRLQFQAKSGATTSFDITNIKIIEITTDTNLPRINYENFSFDGSGNIIPNSGCGSWLWEPQSTNLITQSELFSDASWTKSYVTIIDNNSTSPDGNNNSSLMYPISSGDTRYINTSLTNGSAFHTISFFVKASGKNVVWLYINSSSANGIIYYDLSDKTMQVVSGSVGTPTGTIKSYTNDWYKITYTLGTASVLNSGSGIGVCDAKGDWAVTANGTDGIEIWGAMMEAQSYATSYIPTSGSTVTRNQDLCNNGGSLATINSTSGTLYFEGSVLANTTSFRIISLSDATNSNAVAFVYRNTPNDFTAVVKSGGATSLSKTTILADVTDTIKAAISYKLNDFKFYVNGVLILADTSGNTPIGLNNLQFTDTNGTSNPFFGKTKALAVWKEALSDSELQSLTTI